MIGNIGAIKQDMGNSDPYTIGKAYKKSMQKIPAFYPLDDNIRREDKDGYPEYRFKHFGYQEYGSEGHDESKDR